MVEEQRQEGRTLTIGATELRDSVHEALVQLRSPAQAGLGIHGAHIPGIRQGRVGRLQGQALVVEGRHLVRLPVGHQRQAAILLHLVHCITTTNTPYHRPRGEGEVSSCVFFFFFSKF